jgi:hypothetical protein
MTPYFKHKTKDHFELVEWQKEKLKWCLDNGYAIRDACIKGEEDFETKIYWWWGEIRILEYADHQQSNGNQETAFQP